MSAGEVARLPARERYLRDPIFHALVATLYAHLERGHAEGMAFTPTELREAAVLAAEMWEERHVRPIMVERLDV